MKIQILYDQGTVSIPEDGIIFQPPTFVGVVDGISGLYIPSEGSMMFGGRSGGQLATHILCLSFAQASPEESLEDVLQSATRFLAESIKERGLNLAHSELLPSASFSIAKITEKEITILQATDSLAIWQTSDGEIGATANRFFKVESQNIRDITELMQKHGGNREKTWLEFRPILAKRRRQWVNKPGGYALFNGQPEARDYWQKFVLPRGEVVLLLLFTDGLVPFVETLDMEFLGMRIVRYYHKEGLPAILRRTRHIEAKRKEVSHIDHAEATAIAIEF